MANTPVAGITAARPGNPSPRGTARRFGPLDEVALWQGKSRSPFAPAFCCARPLLPVQSRHERRTTEGIAGMDRLGAARGVRAVPAFDGASVLVRSRIQRAYH